MCVIFSRAQDVVVKNICPIDNSINTVYAQYKGCSGQGKGRTTLDDQHKLSYTAPHNFSSFSVQSQRLLSPETIYSDRSPNSIVDSVMVQESPLSPSLLASGSHDRHTRRLLDHNIFRSWSQVCSYFTTVTLQLAKLAIMKCRACANFLASQLQI